MTAPPLISCIVPVHNGARYLAEALESILAQTWRPIDLIVIDDGSTDDTPAVIDRYATQLRRGRQANAGPASARNHGLRLARGEFVAFLDADDLWHPDKLTRQMGRFDARPELELCLCHVSHFWMPEAHEEAERMKDHRLSRPLPGYVAQTILARHALFAAVGPFDESLKIGEDVEWFLRMKSRNTVFEIHPDVLTRRRMHKHNLSRYMFEPAGKEDHLRIVMAALKQKRQGG